MTHSVADHLAVTPERYDGEIRRFVPGYEAMMAEVIEVLREHLPAGPTRVIDLGTGTGALSGRILAALPDVRMLMLDADAEMLARAELRVDEHRDRVELMHGSFSDPFPSVHAAVASLSLHHVHDRSDKIAMYRNIHSSLRGEGILVTADAMVPDAVAFATPLRKRWAAHLVAHGDTEAQAFDRFARWALEDRYYGVDDEIAMMRKAGFSEVDVRWRVGPTAVVVARKPE